MEGSGIGSPLYSGASSAHVELLPNPDFVFPMRSLEAHGSSNASDNASFAQKWPRQPQGMSSTKRMSGHHMSINALPEFSFNPSGLSPATSPSLSVSTPPSPQPTTPTSPRLVGGHRRGGSEFIGGDSRSGGIGLLSSSPSKSDAILLPPSSSTLLPGPPPGRRGHAHRRSGAISCHDLTSVLQPTDANANGRGASAPTTPMDNEMTPWTGHSANKSISYPSLRPSTEENTSPVDDDSQRPPSRARVGFSDRVEYIRPLSTISSETEGSMSTIRGHSVSNSLSSVISAGAPSPPSSRMIRPLLHTTFEADKPASRPKTAGAVLDKTAKAKESTGLQFFGPQRPTSSNALASPISPVSIGSPMMRQPPKKRTFFHLNHRRAPPSVDMLTSTSEPALVPASPDSPPESPVKEVPQEIPQPSKVPKDKKRARKVKSWTNPFGSKKPKAHASRPTDSANERAPSPPPSTVAVEELGLEDLSANFDVDNTVTIVTPTNEAVPRPTLQTDIASWKPRHLSSPDSDSRSPIIDLDLALGPFEEPKRGSRRDFASARRTMHSSAFSTGLFPPSLSHRRTESAPALVPFELRKASSTSAMADVFEEDEEEEGVEAVPAQKSSVAPKAHTSAAESFTHDDEESETTSESDDDEDSNIGINFVESETADDSQMMWNLDDSGLGIEKDNTEEDHNMVPDMPRSPFSGPADSLTGDTAVEVVEDYEEPRTSSLTRSSDSTVTPTMEEGPKELEPPMSLAVPLPQQSAMTPDTIASSSFPSPDFRYRPSSFEAPRLGTASSFADSRTINSMILGEPGPEFRVSVDDVPSLTSSRSTMTSALQYGNLPMFSPRQPGERTSSVSSTRSTLSERRRKRSSIASLSRLVGGSFGERSKLHIEQRPQSEHMDLSNMKKSKEKKTRRLSKLMQFWRSSYSSK